MRRYLFLILGSILPLAFLFSPKNVFAAEWVNIGFEGSKVSSIFVDPANSDNILASVDNKEVRFSENGGQSWSPSVMTPVASPCNEFAQNPLNQKEIWGACNFGLYHSVDYGHSFARSEYYHLRTSNVFHVKVSSKGLIYVNTSSGFMFKSEDGLIWQAFHTPTSYGFPSIFVNPIDNALFVAFSGIGTYKSTDNGINWVLVNTANTFYGLSSMAFFEDRICGVTNGVAYICSDNGGYDWHVDRTLPDPNNNYLYYISQNPNDIENVLLLRYPRSSSVSISTIYHRKSGDVFWSSEEIARRFNNLMISQGITLAFDSYCMNGLWRNDGIAVKPVLEEKYPVIIVPGILGSWWTFDRGWVLDPLVGTYNDLISTLLASGYKLNSDLFTFPYQWRKSNAESSKKLAEEIQRVKEQTGVKKINIVAHSMGGLVVREYAESDYYGDDVNKIIFLGTPQLGAPKAYSEFEAGSFELEDIFTRAIFNYLFRAEANLSGYFGQDAIFQYIQNNVPSISELLPIDNYLVEKETNIYRDYPIYYPKNAFLENLEKNKGLLSSRKIKIVNLVGNTLDTINSLIVGHKNTTGLWADGKIEGLVFGAGDGTVPLNSALGIPGENIMINSEHRSLPRIAKMEVLKALNASVPNAVETDVVNAILLIGAHSPVNFYVQAPNGQKIGFNKETGGEFTELGESFYSGSDPRQPEFVVIRNPQEGEYKVITTGTGVGVYGIEAVYANNETGQQFTTLYEGITSVGKESKIDVTLNLSQGEIDSQIEDFTPPEVIFEINNRYNHWESLDVNVNSIDNESGVAFTKVLLDDKEIVNNVNLNLFGLDYGNHQIKIISCDQVGNIREIVKDFLLYTDINIAQRDLKYLFEGNDFKSYGAMMRLYVKLESIKYINNINVIQNTYQGILKELDREFTNRQISIFAYNLIKKDVSYLLGG